MWSHPTFKINHILMKKLVIQGIITILIFLSTWLLLKQVNWMSVLRSGEEKLKLEEKLGDLFLDVFRNSGNECTDEFVTGSIDSILTKICLRNSIDRTTIKLHILYDDEINAFALPDGHIIINSALIKETADPEELSGIICHELAHIELDHVMKKLLKEAGLNVLMSATNGGSELARQTAGLLSSSAYDRSLESDADIMAVDLLLKSCINPAPFADILSRISETDDKTLEYISWINTHPEGKIRAENIRQHYKNEIIKNEKLLSEVTWDKIKLEFPE